MGKTLEEYREDTREYYRDLAAHNRLLRFNEEFEDSEIERAINKALDLFNNMPPRGSATLADFPSDSLLVDMAICQLLKMSGFQKTRNSLNYSDAGTTIADTEKVGQYMNWINMLCRQSKQEAQTLKRVMNAVDMMGGNVGIGSDYGLLE